MTVGDYAKLRAYLDAPERKTVQTWDDWHPDWHKCSEDIPGYARAGRVTDNNEIRRAIQSLPRWTRRVAADVALIMASRLKNIESGRYRSRGLRYYKERVSKGYQREIEVYVEAIEWVAPSPPHFYWDEDPPEEPNPDRAPWIKRWWARVCARLPVNHVYGSSGELVDIALIPPLVINEQENEEWVRRALGGLVTDTLGIH